MSRTLRKAAIRLPLAALAMVVAAGCTAVDRRRRCRRPPGSGDRRTACATSEWTTYDQNGLRTGVDASGADVHPPDGGLDVPVLDGSLYGQPLIYSNRVFAATENDTVYGLAADTGAVLWKTHVGTPFDPNTVPDICGNIRPTVGITGTPVIDSARGELFAVATEQVPGGASHHLVGLDLYTGAVVLDEDIDPASVVAPAYELQRVSLGLTDGRVIIGMGGNSGDCGTYHGLVISAPEDGSTPSTFTVADLPGDNQGAVWMGGAAPVIDAQGDVWVSTGNAATGSNPGRLGQRPQAEPDDGAARQLHADHLEVRQRQRPGPGLHRAGAPAQRHRVPGRQAAHGLRPAVAPTSGGSVAS